MDGLWPLLVLALIYILPELLKKRKAPTEYKYPDIPEETGRDMPLPQHPQIKPLEHLSSLEYSAQPVETGINLDEVAPQMEVIHQNGTNPFQGKLTRSAIVNGFVFAEILQPPRAFRPLAHICKKRN